MLGPRSRSRDLEWLLSMCREELEPKSLLAAPGDSQQPEVDEGVGEREEEEIEEQWDEEEAELLRCKLGGLEALATDATGTVRDSMEIKGCDLSLSRLSSLLSSSVMASISGSSITQLLSFITGRVNAEIEEETIDRAWWPPFSPSLSTDHWWRIESERAKPSPGPQKERSL